MDRVAAQAMGGTQAAASIDDAQLEALLAAAKIGQSPGAVRALVQGVAAAPEAEDKDAWMALLGDGLPDALKAALRALLAETRAALDDGFGDGLPAGTHAARVAALRAELARRGITGFIVPRADEHQGEYVPRRANRLAWISGFTGSAGAVVVLRAKAALFVDGRYTLQAKDEVDGAVFEIRHLVEEPPSDWLPKVLGKDDRVGYDPWLHTPQAVERLKAGCEQAGAQLVACGANPLDAVWPGQAAAPLAPVVVQPADLVGRSAAEKRAALAEELQKKDCAAVVLSAPDSICWLLNIRGGDLPRTPFALGFAIAARDGSVALFTDPRKLTQAVRVHLGNEVSVAPTDTLGPALEALIKEGGKRVMLDPATAPAWIADRLQAAGAKLVPAEDPCTLPKACKTPQEIAGARAAHARDGLAMVRFLAWLAAEAPKGKLTELDVVAQLAAFRRRGERFRDFSFDTIAGAGPNGAIVHYRASARTNRRVEPGQLLLVDSGGQYVDGTTDVTRTVAVGAPTDEHRDRFTRVLRGHVALALLRFPEGTTGSQIDALARAPLWAAGLDFDHGTGHGVGSYLSVHEGPHRISKVANKAALKPGMIVSNEPGYYKTGAYGIRIENLVTVIPAPADAGPFKPDRAMLAFETLTLAPIDRALIDPALMTAPEIAWLDAYHARVRATHAQALQAGGETAVLRWLEAATAPVAA